MALTRREAVAVLTAPGAPFELVATDVRGVRLRTFRRAPGSLREILEASRAFGERDHLVYRDERLTFADHLRLTAGLAQRLREHHGVAKGDRVAIGMRNLPEWAVAFWATQVLGAVAVPLNAWWIGGELRYAIEDSGAKLAVLDGERHDRLAAHLPELDLEGTIVVRAQGELAPGAERWDDVVAGLDPLAELPAMVIDPDDDATILYTSGTTGAPKGAVGTHRNHITNHLNVLLRGAVSALVAGRDWTLPTPADPSPCALQAFPFFHIGGLTALYVSAGLGGRIVLQHRWDVDEALQFIERERVTSLTVVPTILRELLAAPALAKADTSSLLSITSGGTSVPPDLVDAVDKRFASAVAPANGYGLTETTSAFACNEGGEYVANPTSVGRPLPGNDVRVVDPDTGLEKPLGGVGELWCRGPNVVRGYWRRDDATAEAFTDGWFHTGDLGCIDEAGFIYVVDRLKDVVIRGGENVYSAEVEAALLEHPAVADVAIIGLPDERLGEEVAAVVQVAPGTTLTEEELRGHARDRLARFKVPSRVFLQEDPLPRTATGKVLKVGLRDRLA